MGDPHGQVFFNSEEGLHVAFDFQVSKASLEGLVQVEGGQCHAASEASIGQV